MTATTTLTQHKSHIKHIAVAMEPGTSGSEAIKDAAILALQQGVPVTLSHNHRQYHIDPEAVLRLVAIQSPLISGKMSVPARSA